MARIEKLQIQGFRSFGTDDKDPGPQKIDFIRKSVSCSPLTLILGQNGCGKTTIIECLRYVTTGDCPPGSFGGRSFVHDPKMAGEPVVTANVKLQFTGSDKDKYIISRSMEATQKVKQISVKTLDSTITRRKVDTGETFHLSMKCADINTQIFHALGVSKPILNYVIFCHQEDSNWPLDEGTKVKEKFDEIFASSKYNECLKKIKDVRLEQKRLHANLKKDIEYLSSDKKMADDKKRELRKKNSDRNDLQAELDSIEEELEPVRRELRELAEVEKNFSGVQEKITKSKTSLEHCRKEMNELRSCMLEVIPSTTSLEEIEAMKRSLNSEQKDKKEKIDELGFDLRKLQNEKDRVMAEMEKNTSRTGECRGLREKFERDKKDLSSALTKTGRALGWDVTDSSFVSDTDVMEAIENIKDNGLALEEKLGSLTSSYDAKIEDEASKISRLKIQQAQLEEQKKMKVSEKIRINRDLAKIRRDLSDDMSESSTSKLDSVKQDLEKKQSELEELKTQFDRDTLSATMRQLKSEMSTLEKQETDLKEEVAGLETQREISSEIGIKKSDLEVMEKKIERFMSKNCTELTHLFEGTTIPEPDRLKTEFHSRLDKLTEVKKKTEAEISRLKADVGSKREHWRTVQKELAALEDRLKTLNRKLEEVISLDEDFEEALSVAKSDVDRTRLELQVKEANKFTYQEYIERIRNMQALSRAKTCCPTCNRPFEKDSEVATLLDDLESEIRKIPTKVQSLQTKYKKSVAKQERLQTLLPDKKRADELRHEVADKKNQVTSLDRDIRKLDESITEKEEALEVTEVDYSMCEQLREDVLSIDRLYADCLQLKRRICELTDQCSTRAGARDYDTVRAELEGVSKKISSVRADLEVNQETMMTFEKKCNELEHEINMLGNRKLEIEQKHLNRVKNEAKKGELETAIHSIETSLTGLEEQLKPLGIQIDAAITARANLMAERERKSRDLKDEIERVRRFENEVVAIQKQVIDYTNSANESTLARLMADHVKLTEKKNGLETRAKKLETEKSTLEEELSQQVTKKRNYDDNIRLRNYLASEKEYEAEMSKYKERLDRLDYSSVQRKRNELGSTYEDLERTKSEKRGRLSEMDVVIRDLERELNSDKLKLAESRHREKSIEFQCRQHAVDDLNKYYIALNWAIMNFHEERMRQINKIVRQLWRSTYKGNDIDYIEIKTDVTEAIQGADKRRTCNYRVIMVKNDTEMEMRGRCSAGQKVLASLIIRLALAETFSSALGMIALDEPTTNLDRENIESLAGALSDLVVSHSRQHNFQLIVITHDEDLIDLLSKVDQVDHYFKVGRNDRGLSIIRKIATESR